MSNIRKLNILYARVSTEQHVNDGMSLGVQKDTLFNYCISQGYELIKEGRIEGYIE